MQLLLALISSKSMQFTGANYTHTNCWTVFAMEYLRLIKNEQLKYIFKNQIAFS